MLCAGNRSAMSLPRSDSGCQSTSHHAKIDIVDRLPLTARTTTKISGSINFLDLIYYAGRLHARFNYHLPAGGSRSGTNCRAQLYSFPQPPRDSASGVCPSLGRKKLASPVMGKDASMRGSGILLTTYHIGHVVAENLQLRTLSRVFFSPLPWRATHVGYRCHLR